MPRYRPGASRQTVSSRSGAISENAVVYSSSGGHNHDGANSSLIDVNKYSLWDFTLNTIYSTNDRTSKQNSHIEQFRNYVTNIIINDAFGAAGVTLGDNVINANNIVSGSISTDLLRTDAIKSTNYSYTSGDFSTAGTFLNLSDGSIISKEFFIDSSGNAGFAGAISGGTIDIGGLDTSSFHVNSAGDMWLGNSVYSGAPFRVSRDGDIVASSATITGTINATGGYIGNATTGFDIASTSITSHDFVTSGTSRGKLRLYSYGDVFIDSSPTSGTHSGQEWRTSFVGEWIEVGRTDTGNTHNITIGSTNGADSAMYVSINNNDGDAKMNMISSEDALLYMQADYPAIYMFRNDPPPATPSHFDNQFIRLYNNNNNSGSVTGIGFALANGSGCVLRAWQGNTSASAYVGGSGTSSGYGSGGNGLDVGNRAGTGYGFMGANAFVVRSSETIKQNIEYLPVDTRVKSVDRIKGLKPARWDDLVGAQKSIVDEESGKDIDVIDHICDNEDCGGTSENPCGVYAFHKGRYGFIAEDVAKVFPKAVQITEDNKPIGIDYAPITFSLVETVQVLLEEIEQLKAQIQDLSQ